MTYPVLNAKVLTLQTGETLVIRFSNEPEFSGELRISWEFKLLPDKQIKEIQRVLKEVAMYVTATYIK